MTSFLPEVQAFTAYLEAAIAANPDYEGMTEIEQEAYRRAVLEQCANDSKATGKVPVYGAHDVKAFRPESEGGAQ